MGQLQKETYPVAIADKCLTTRLSHKRENVIGCELLFEPKVKTDLSSTKNTPRACLQREKSSSVWTYWAYLDFPSQDCKGFWWWRKQRGLDTSFVFLPTMDYHSLPHSLPACCPHFHHRPLFPKSHLTRLTHIRGAPISLRMFELKAKHTYSSSEPLGQGHLGVMCGREWGDRDVLQSSGEDLWDSLEPLSLPIMCIRVVCKGPQEQQSNLTNHPFSVLLNKFPHHSAWKTRICPLLILLPRLRSLRARPKSHPSSDTIEFSEAKTSQGKSNKSRPSSSRILLQQMYFLGK